MKKKILALALSVTCLLSFGNASSVLANESDQSQVEVNVNGEFIQTDVHPVLDQSSLLLPIRTLSSLGLSYNWDPSTKSATVKNNNHDVLIITENSRTAYKNGNPSEMPVPVQNIKGRLLIPIRFVSETMGYDVQYETIRKIAFVTSEDYRFDTNSLNQEDLQLARKAAMSLPLTADFKTLNNATRFLHNYSFPAGKADQYLFNDSFTHSLVEIKGGKATVVAQFVVGDRSNFSQTAGNITSITDLIMQPYLSTSTVHFMRSSINSSTTSYYEGEEQKRFTHPITVYSDIIQKIPGNK